MRSYCAAVSAGVLLAFSAFPALAWNGAGHRIVAVIAWQHMSEEAQVEALRLLSLHPDAEAWRHRLKIGDDRPLNSGDANGQHFLAEAATWADDIKREGFGRHERAAAGDEREWHYLNWPLGLPRTAARSGQLERQIGLFSSMLAGYRDADGERVTALVWLLHLIADAHQPLHVATRLDGDGKRDDAGGNGYVVLDPGHPRLPETNLHTFWDDLPGPPWLRGKRLLNAASRLMGRCQAEAAASDSVETWLRESHELAGSRVYPDADPPFTMNSAYRAAARKLAEERLACGGARLGRWLDRLLTQTAKQGGDRKLAVPR